MDEKTLMGEQLIKAWLNLSSTVWNRRVVSSMTFNEVFVCSLLKRQMDTDPSTRLTATDLCEKTGLYKSQMNKVLNTLEENSLIRRVRSQKDKRFVYIELSDEGINQYLEEHEKIMSVMDRLIDAVGKDVVNETTTSVNIVADELKKIIK